MTLPQFLRSRKFWAAAVSVLFVVAKSYLPNFPLSEEQIFAVVAALASYILGTALEDGLKAR